IVQVGDGPSQSQEPLADQLARQPLRMPAEHDIERFAGDVFHDHPVIALAIGAQVVEVHQVGVLEVQALSHAAQLDMVVAADQFEANFFPSIADGKVDLAKTATPDATLERVALERPLTGTVVELHGHPSHSQTRNPNLEI